MFKHCRLSAHSGRLTDAVCPDRSVCEGYCHHTDGESRLGLVIVWSEGLCAVLEGCDSEHIFQANSRYTAKRYDLLGL